MRPIGDTVSSLRDAKHAASGGNARHPRLVALPPFGSNPGALNGWYHVPESDVEMPLVVVLHGCTQTAAGYDRGAGWSALGERYGFAVLLPEQQRSNNPNLCFNWFAPDDTRRDCGEASSIRQMVAAMVASHAIDPARLFVTGLSAGGAMASTMLATYPDIFAGGAIIAGLPYGAAASMPQAFERMRGHGHVTDDAYAGLVRAASPHEGPWPVVSVWQGTADTTVNPANARAIVGQWRSVHGVASSCDSNDIVDGQPHRIWLDTDGRICVEEYSIAGMGHGTPLKLDGPMACGERAPFMLDAGISSTWHIAQRWGLLDNPAIADLAASPPTCPPPSRSGTPPPLATQTNGVQQIIEAALRSAGLMH